MKKSIVLLLLCCVGFWSCDSGKSADTSAEVATKAETTTPATTVSNVVTTEKTEVEATTALGKFEFEEESFDFGTIKQGDVVEHLFKFKNVGEGPLIISKTKVTCGCTTPSYSKEPIAPGEEGEILVKFNSRGKLGQQNKTVTISANVEGGVDRISIRTNVEAPASTQNMMGPVKDGE